MTSLNDTLNAVRRLHHAAVDLDLSRMVRLLSSLQNPQNHMPPAVHVAGTNGKGSTLAFLEAMLRSCGYGVHKFISPHLVHFCERITLNCPPWEKGQLTNPLAIDTATHKITEALNVTLTHNQNQTLTEFELITCAAFHLFAKIPADFSLIEVGLGGRLDATNVLSFVSVTAITSIGFDHMEFLGNTLGQIAFEKAGIIKPNVPVVIPCNLPQEALKVIEYVAIQKNALVVIAQPICLTTPTFSLGLLGDHQRYNAGIAVEIFKQLLPNEAVPYEALSQTQWKGRLEPITLRCDGADHHFLVDGAHNREGAQVLAQYISKTYAQKLIFFVHIKKRKQFIEILEQFVPLAHKIFLIDFPLEGGDHVHYVDLRLLHPTLNFNIIEPLYSFDQVLQMLQQYPSHRNLPHIGTGSLFWVGQLYLL